MDESPLETREHQEHAEHAAEGHPLVTRVSVTIALLAVIAAAIASVEGNESGAAISAKNDAVLFQDKASDSWNFFQAKTIKESLFSIAADRGGPHAQAYRAEAARHGSATEGAQKEAKGFEAKSEGALAISEKHEARHHRLDLAGTFLHIAIAISTISIITRKPWPWWASIGLGAAGVILAASAYF